MAQNTLTTNLPSLPSCNKCCCKSNRTLMTIITNQRQGAVLFETLSSSSQEIQFFLRNRTFILAFIGPKSEVCVTFYDKVTPVQILS